MTATYQIPLGVHRYIPAALYHSDQSAVSATFLKRCATDSIEFAEHYRDNPEDPTLALRLGAMTHAGYLERLTMRQQGLAILPDGIKKPTARSINAKKPSKESAANMQAYAAWLQENPGCKPVDEDEWQRVAGMLWSLHNRDANCPLREIARAARAAATETETTLCWLEDGIRCKARIDMRTPVFPTSIVDLKCLENPTASGFLRQAEELAWHIQDNHYSIGWNICMPDEFEVDSFAFLAVGSQPPHSVGVYFLGKETRELARVQRRGIMQRLRDLAQGAGYRGLAAGAKTLHFRPWKFK